MSYIKLTNDQINTLKSLPNNLNNKMTNKNIGGIIIVNKKNELKQIIMDFASSSLEEFYTQKTKVSLFKHIKNEDPVNNLVLTYEITNFLNNKEEFNTYYAPSLFEFIKCVIHSIYRSIFFHIVITSSGNIFVLNMKKKYYNDLKANKIKNKIKIKDMIHSLMKEYSEYFLNRNKLEIPQKIEEKFNCKKFKNNGVEIEYLKY